MYPSEQGKRFDFDYYATKHGALIRQKLEPVGLVRLESDKAVDATSPFAAIGHMYFNSLEEFQNGFFAHAAEFAEDLPNFTDIAPQLQVSEIFT